MINATVSMDTLEQSIIDRYMDMMAERSWTGVPDVQDVYYPGLPVVYLESAQPVIVMAIREAFERGCNWGLVQP